MDIQSILLSMQEPAYRDFSVKLMPTVDPKTVLGIRIPKLRKLAREIANSSEAACFLDQLPHTYFEENNLHGFLICQIQDFEECIDRLERFLPYINNWATCDSLRPKCFAKHKKELLEKIKEWLRSPHPYTVRFGIEMLMCYFLDTDFCKEYLDWVAAIHSEEYYVNMMIAWYFATALAKQWETALTYLEKEVLSPWVHNKTIQKAVESYRISSDQKTVLRTRKIKAVL